MNSLRTQYLLHVSFILIVAAIPLVMAVKSYKSLQRQQAEIKKSGELSSLVYWIIQDPSKEVDQRSSSLRKLIDHTTPPNRRATLVTLLESLERQHRSNIIIPKAQAALRNEIEIQNYWREKNLNLQKKIELFLMMAIGFLVAGLALSFAFIEFKFLRPTKVLYKKMFEFINNKYSYQFKVPKSDELGQLEGTFNSLAQKVIANLEELRSLDQAKSDFLSIASHELRTPMTSIKGSLSLLQMGVGGPLGDQVVNLLQIAEKETDRLIRLINDLLDLAKVEARQFSLKKDWIYLDELIESTCDGIRGLAQSAHVHLSVEVPLSLQINADGDRIQQVLTNLLSNAIKFSPEESTIRISSEITDGNILTISVKDQGPGIAPSDQALIFDKFRQATSPQNPLVKGTGLGLAIAKALVEEHGGQIGVHSSIGEGSSFYFTLIDWRFALKQNKDEKAPAKGIAA